VVRHHQFPTKLWALQFGNADFGKCIAGRARTRKRARHESDAEAARDEIEQGERIWRDLG
jgi:hypothetical protein